MGPPARVSAQHCVIISGRQRLVGLVGWDVGVGGSFADQGVGAGGERSTADSGEDQIGLLSRQVSCLGRWVVVRRERQLPDDLLVVLVGDELAGVGLYWKARGPSNS
jgi:hypothetical protein